MAIYSEYLSQFNGGFEPVQNERKAQLKRIAELRGRDIIVYACDVHKNKAAISIDYSDILPISELIENLNADKIDVLIETPGGSAEIAEDIVKLLRAKFKETAFIIPGMAKSAGTIMVMAGDEILMSPSSSIGPIDAQIISQGKVFSADAFLEGLNKIKEEVATTGVLNRAYIPILQNISPGEIQGFENALEFSKKLVRRWLATYKFKNWTTHSSTGLPVTDADRESRAHDIAHKLCDHGHWLTHGRSIKIDDLREMRLSINDYSENPPLYDAIKRYYTLMRMTFESTNIYKLFETTSSQIYRFQSPIETKLPDKKPQAGKAEVEVKCNKCQKSHNIQINLGTAQPIKTGFIPFPKDSVVRCECGAEYNLSDLKLRIESDHKLKIV